MVAWTNETESAIINRDQKESVIPTKRQTPIAAPAKETTKSTLKDKTAKLHPTVSALKSMIETSLDDDKAETITTIDLRGRSSLADLMIVASGRSSRHLSAMADHLLEKLKQGKYYVGPVEGKQDAEWVLVDAGDIIVHLFQPEVRAFYNLEKLWLDPTLTPDNISDAIKEKKAKKAVDFLKKSTKHAATKTKKAPAKAGAKTGAKSTAKSTPAKPPVKKPVRKAKLDDANKPTAKEMGNINRLKTRAKKLGK